jgi:N-acetylglucosaminyldiphosphoundecaprenol N-acetyl-beta-D-mannosaminyltransferase
MNIQNVLGVKVNTGFTMESALEHIEKNLLSSKIPNYICTTNSEFVMKAQEDTEFKTIINNSALSLPDGIGVVMALEYLRKVEKLPKGIFLPLQALVQGINTGLFSHLNEQRISGMSLVYNLCKLSASKGYTVFFLGGRKRNMKGELEDTSVDVSQLAIQNMQKEFPGLKVIGGTSEYTHNMKDDEETLKYIHRCMAQHGVSHIDVLFVAYNFVTQEKWIVRNMNKIPATLSLGVGRTIDHMAFTSDLSVLANKQRKTEWLMSIINTPWKLKRIATAFPGFPIKVFLSSITS